MPILEVFNKLYLGKRDYCVICLRSCEERRMDDIQNLELLFKKIKWPTKYYDDKLCYVCAHQAEATLNFLTAVMLSSVIHNMYNVLKSRRNRRQITFTELPPNLKRSAMKWHKVLKKIRSHPSLDTTNVTSQNGSQTKTCESSEASNFLIDLTETSEVHKPIIDEDPLQLEPKTSEIYIEATHIKEENEIRIKYEDAEPEEITIEESNPIVPDTVQPKNQSSPEIAAMQHALTADTALDTTKALLNPFVLIQGKIFVPTLAGQMIDGRLVAVDNPHIILQVSRVALQMGSDYIVLYDPTTVANVLRNVTFSNLGSCMVISAFLPVQILESNVSKTMSVLNMNGFNAQEESLLQRRLEFRDTKLHNMNNVNTDSPTKVTNYKQNLQFNPKFVIRSGNGCGESSLGLNKAFTPTKSCETPIKSTDNSDKSVIKQAQNVVSKKGKAVSKTQGKVENSKRKIIQGDENQEKVKKQRETDWEDKIPMEVISFMDAIDPNAETILGIQGTSQPTIGLCSLPKELIGDKTDVRILNYDLNSPPKVCSPQNVEKNDHSNKNIVKKYVNSRNRQLVKEVANTETEEIIDLC